MKSTFLKDPQICLLANWVKSGFPSNKGELPSNTLEYWDYRDGLNLMPYVVLHDDRIIIATALRERVLNNLHSAHQGVCSMSSQLIASQDGQRWFKLNLVLGHLVPRASKMPYGGYLLHLEYQKR